MAAASVQSRPIGPPPITATSSLASIPSGGHGRVVGDRERLDERALANESSSGMRCSQDALATKYSASAPLIEKPKWSSPLLTTHSPTTRSPARSVVTPLPTSATSPDHSWPGMIGYETGMM